MAGRGCRLALAAGVVAAVCAEDGGPGYGLPVHVLLAAHGGMALRSRQVDSGAWWVQQYRASLATALGCKLQAAAHQPAVGRRLGGAGPTVGLCRRVIALCWQHTGQVEGSGACGSAGVSQAQVEGAEGDAAQSQPPHLAGAGGWLGEQKRGDVVHLMVQALRALGRALAAREVRRKLSALRGSAAAASGQVPGGEAVREGEVRAAVASRWRPVGWWRQVLRALPLLLEQEGEREEHRAAGGQGQPLTPAPRFWTPRLHTHYTLMFTEFEVLPRNGRRRACIARG